MSGRIVAKLTGVVLLLLGIWHFINMANFAKIDHKRRRVPADDSLDLLET